MLQPFVSEEKLWKCSCQSVLGKVEELQASEILEGVRKCTLHVIVGQVDVSEARQVSNLLRDRPGKVILSFEEKKDR